MLKGFSKLALFVFCLVGLGVTADRFDAAKEFANNHYFMAMFILLIASMAIYSLLRVIGQRVHPKARQAGRHKRQLVSND